MGRRDGVSYCKGCRKPSSYKRVTLTRPPLKAKVNYAPTIAPYEIISLPEGQIVDEIMKRNALIDAYEASKSSDAQERTFITTRLQWNMKRVSKLWAELSTVS